MYHLIIKVKNFIFQFIKSLFVLDLISNKEFHLKKISLSNLRLICINPNIEKKWKKFVNSQKSINFFSNSGGINLKDQKIIFYLICHYKPKRILEIGTHLGHSLNVISNSLKVSSLNRSSIDTIDIYNVNQHNKFVKFYKPLSPANLLKNNKYLHNVRFHSKGSDYFFKNNKKKFNFIFIDGNHTIDQTIKDISNSLKILDKNGIILIHDYHIIRDFNHFIKKLFGPYYAVKIINNRLNKN